jgi:hypothetical protein
MKYEPVKSSNIAGIGYEPDTQTLGIKFAKGGIWHYTGVSHAQYQALINAPSIGSHFQTEIRHKFASQKIEGAQA